MDLLLAKGAEGSAVRNLQSRLLQALDDDAAEFPGLAEGHGRFDTELDAAVRRWQSGVGLIADGLVGPRCLVLLGALPPPTLQIELTVGQVSRLFPQTKPANIARYLPYIEAALAATGLVDAPMVLAALGTIRAETEGFVPIAELPSKFNTRPGMAPFSAYDNRPKFGHTQPGDGAKYRGRGFVQLTWKVNYQEYGQKIGLALAERPELANAPEVAALLLARFLADRATAIRDALIAGDFAAARKAVNGGTHGLDRFRDTFARAPAEWRVALPEAALAGALAQRGGPGIAEPPVSRRVGAARGSKTHKDATDLRDRPYMPPAISLPDEFPTRADIERFLPEYTQAGLILDQGPEGACTGFGLACVVNYLRWIKGRWPARMPSVSPRMLYTLARRHDEYQGESYEGSSCRGALKGWFNHGVCLEPDWPYEPDKASPPRYGYARRAADTTLGVYYRVDTKSITDLQAAIAQHGAVFVSSFTHEGWSAPAESSNVPRHHADLPVIPFDGRPSLSDGHAYALVGFNAQGFVLQNSWGPAWGAGGFAVISYLDWLANAMDAWVVALGVPGVIAGRLASGSGGATRTLAQADRSKWWEPGLAYRHSVVLGNDGRVARYLTEDEPPRKLQQQAYVLPDQWFRRGDAASPKRLVIYAHGGLNSEADAMKRVAALGRHFIGNGCYPLFLVWKTGLLESIGHLLADHARREPARAGGPLEWLAEKTDAVIEKTVGRPLARPLWSEMKENGALAFEERRGGTLLVDAIAALAETWGEAFELHLVGHSAGSIPLGHMLDGLASRRVGGGEVRLLERVKTVQLYAPACTVAFANRHYAVANGLMERLHLEVLSDERERDDSVAGIYRKSLLYLVSNALEADQRTPLLGLERINDPRHAWDGSSTTGDALATWRRAAEAAKLASRTKVVSADRVPVAIDAEAGRVHDGATHGSFDNNLDVVTRTLERITGAALVQPVDDLRGY